MSLRRPLVLLAVSLALFFLTTPALSQSTLNFCAVSSGLGSAWTIVTSGTLTVGTNNVATAITGTRSVYTASNGVTATTAIGSLLPTGSLLGGLTTGGKLSTTGNDNVVIASNTGVAQLSTSGLAFSLATSVPLPTGTTASTTYTNVSNVLLFNAVQLAEAGSATSGTTAAITQSASPAYSTFTASTSTVTCPTVLNTFAIPSAATPTTLNFCYQSVSASASYSSATYGTLTVTSSSLSGTDNDYMLGQAVTIVNITGTRSFYSPSTGTVTSAITGLAAPRTNTTLNQQGYPANNLIAVQGSNSGWLDRSGLTFTVSPATYLGPDFTASQTSNPTQTSVIIIYEITGYVESGLKGSAQPVADLVYFNVGSSVSTTNCPVVAPSSIGTLQWTWNYTASAGPNNWTVSASGLLITTNVTQPVADFGSGTFEGGLPYPAQGYKLLGITGTRYVNDSGNTVGRGAGYTTSAGICGTVPTSIGDEQPDNLLFINQEAGVLLSQAGIGYLLTSPSILPRVGNGATINDVNLFFMNHTSPYATNLLNDEYSEANGQVESGAPYEPIQSSFTVTPTSGQSISSKCTSLGATGSSSGAAAVRVGGVGSVVAAAIVLISTLLVSAW